MKLLSATLNHTIFNVSFKLKIPIIVNINHASMYVCQFYLFVLISDVDGEGNGTSSQYSCLENPMDGGAWCTAVHGVTKSWTRLSDFTFTFLFHALEKEMATHSSVLAWRIPGTGESGGLTSMGSQSRMQLK